MLFKVGDQVPLIPLLETVGSGDKKAPAHIGATALKVGSILALTVNCLLAAIGPQEPPLVVSVNVTGEAEVAAAV